MKSFTKLSLVLSLGIGLISATVARAQNIVTNKTYPTGQSATEVGPNTIQTSGTVTVSSGATVTFQAATSILLGPGVTITSDSDFRAWINPASAQLSVISGSSAGTGTLGTAFNYQIVASNNPTEFTAIGLPTGLTLNGSTGLISGTPNIFGRFLVLVTTTNASGSYTTTLTLDILSSPYADSDVDGMPDGWEVANGLNPGVNDASADLDNDGLTNVREYFLGTNPTAGNRTATTALKLQMSGGAGFVQASVATLGLML